MANFSEIIQEINTNLPDNTTQAITAAKLRTTLIDLTNTIDNQQDGFESDISQQFTNFENDVNAIVGSYTQVEVADNLTTDSSTKALSAKQGKILSEEINGETVYDYNVNLNIQYRSDITLRPVTSDTSSYALTGESYGVYYIQSSWYPEFVQGNRIYVKAGDTYPTYLMFITQSLGTISGGSNRTLGWLVDGDYLCNNHYNSETETWTSAIVVPAGEEAYFDIPENCYRVLIGLKDTYAELEPCQTMKIGVARLEGGLLNDIDDLDDRVTDNTDSIEDIYDTIYGEVETVETEIDFDSTPTKIGQLLASRIAGSSIGSNGRIWVIPVSPGDTLDIAAQSNKGVYLCIMNANPSIPSGGLDDIATTYKATNCTGYTTTGTGDYRMVISSGETATIVIESNSDAKYVYVQKLFQSSTEPLTPQSFTITKQERIGGIIENIKSSNGIYLSVYLGDLDDNGNVVESTNRAVTDFINNGNGFYIELKEGYQVERALLFDNNGKIASKNFYVHNTSGHANTDTNCWGSNNGLEQFLVKVVIKKNDGGNVDLNGLIRKFVYFNDSRLTKVIPSDNDFYTFTTKMNQLNNIVWKAVEKAEHNNGGGGTNRALWFLKNSTVIGVPYSGVGEYSKFIGIDVMFKTFLTAAQNPRSVIYTEMIEGGHNPNITKYGFSYHGEENYSGNFYGSICTGLYSYVLGQPICAYVADIPSILGTSRRIAYGSTDSDGNPIIKMKNSGGTYDTVTIDQLVSNLEPMDLIWNTGHISLVSDIYKDEYGRKQYVVWSEQTGPCGRDIPYSRENLQKRLDNLKISGKNWNIYRLNTSDWQTNLSIPYEDTTDYIQNMFYDFGNKTYEIDSDISTFEGEYPVFVMNGNENDGTSGYNNYKAFLNIHRNKGQYDTLKIYNEADDAEQEEAIKTIDISSNSGTYIYNSTNIYPNDDALIDDWIIVDLNQIPSPLAPGKYKARLVGTNAESGFTHFQFVKITFSLAKNTTTPTQVGLATFSVEGGTPFMIAKQGPFGVTSSDDKVTLESTDTSNDLSSKEWVISSTFHPYVKLYAHCDYGTAVKRINLNTYWN